MSLATKEGTIMAIHKIETENFTVTLVPWRYDDRYDARTRLYASSLIDYKSIGDQPPVSVKGDDPENDKAWRRYNRAELNSMNNGLNAFELELYNTPDPTGLLAEIYEALVGYTRKFSRKAGCSCGCSPGFVMGGKVYARLDGIRQSRLIQINVARKAKTPPSAWEVFKELEGDSLEPERTFTMDELDPARS
jgi:hypothetical protein